MNIFFFYIEKEQFNPRSKNTTKSILINKLKTIKRNPIQIPTITLQFAQRRRRVLFHIEQISLIFTTEKSCNLLFIELSQNL